MILAMIVVGEAIAVPITIGGKGGPPEHDLPAYTDALKIKVTVL